MNAIGSVPRKMGWSWMGSCGRRAPRRTSSLLELPLVVDAEVDVDCCVEKLGWVGWGVVLSEEVDCCCWTLGLRLETPCGVHNDAYLMRCAAVGFNPSRMERGTMRCGLDDDEDADDGVVDCVSNGTPPDDPFPPSPSTTPTVPHANSGKILNK